MNRYAISLTDLYSFNTSMTMVNADNEIQALYYGYSYFTQDDGLRTNISSVEDFEQEMFSRFYAIGVMKIEDHT